MLPNVVGTDPAAVGYKDEILDRLARTVNIAQFVSFDPQLRNRFAWLNEREPNALFSSPEAACEALLRSAESHAVNVRAFKPGDSKGHKLAFNLRRVDEIISAVGERAARGLFTIANELIPIDDGGISGVSVRDVIEFAPDDTPKCVDKPGIASLPRLDGVALLELVYGFRPAIDFGAGVRVEFSLHPIRRGLRREHTIIWELEPSSAAGAARVGGWPNRFSQFLGDKPYGLLIANMLGFAVPCTTVIGRSFAPFIFGERTGTNETWMRTCPRTPIPGRYVTDYGWRDPFAYLAEEDPSGEILASVLAQESVEFVWSGAASTTEDGVVIEGHPGRGDAFMLGEAKSMEVPPEVRRAVARCHEGLVASLRSVKFEWVWDGSRVWIVQLHRRAKGVSRSVIYAGKAERYIRFDPSQGLDTLRQLISEIAGTSAGVIVSGEVGVTSHVGDLLRGARIPSHLEWAENDGPTQLSFV